MSDLYGVIVACILSSLIYIKFEWDIRMNNEKYKFLLERVQSLEKSLEAK